LPSAIGKVLASAELRQQFQAASARRMASFAPEHTFAQVDSILREATGQGATTG
jgi:hypothetical protein